MNTQQILILAFLLILGCNQIDQTTIPEDSGADSTDKSLLVHDVLASHSAIKIGAIPSITIKQNVICTGTIEVPPTELISVHSMSEGFINWMTYLPGDHVKKGALLFKITNTRLVEKQRILLETKAKLAMARKDYDRKIILQSERVTTEKAVDESTAHKDLLTATYEGLKNELQLLGVDVQALEEFQKFQSSLSVYATHEGYVHQVNVNQGQMIEPRDELMEIANGDHVHLELQVLSKYVQSLAIGQKVQFMLPNSSQKFTAEIVKLNPMVNHETGTLNVHCHIDEETNMQIIAGTFVNAEIQVEAVNVHGLPLEAVIKQGNDYYAYFVQGDQLQKHLLKNVQVAGDFVTFDSLHATQMVIAGAYYIE